MSSAYTPDVDVSMRTLYAIIESPFVLVGVIQETCTLVPIKATLTLTGDVGADAATMSAVGLYPLHPITFLTLYLKV